MDRQGALENLCSIETTAKLLVNALTKRDLSFDGAHREELISQTSTFLGHAQTLVLQLSNTYNLPTETLIQSRFFKDGVNGTSSICHALQVNENNGAEEKPHSITLDDIIQHRWTVKDLLPNYPLLPDSSPLNLMSLVRSLRSIDNLDDLLLKAYSKIFTDDERLCCRYDGLQGQLSYPRAKRLLFDQLVKLIFHERHLPCTDEDQRQLYAQCEKHFSSETSSRNADPHFDADISASDENEWICTLFRHVFSREDVKRVLRAKQELKSPWDTNEMSFFHARLTHLRWVKQKWFEHYPCQADEESQRWSQCLDWAMDSFILSPKVCLSTDRVNEVIILPPKQVRASKRKTMEPSVDEKRSKATLSFEEQYQQIDRTKCDVAEYAGELLQLIFQTNQKNLPTFEQLQLVERLVGRYYWTSNAQQSWSNILDKISSMFKYPSNDEPFRLFYSKRLRDESHEDRANEIDRLLQIS